MPPGPGAFATRTLGQCVGGMFIAYSKSGLSRQVENVSAAASVTQAR